MNSTFAPSLGFGLFELTAELLEHADAFVKLNAVLSDLLRKDVGKAEFKKPVENAGKLSNGLRQSQWSVEGKNPKKMLGKLTLKSP